MKRIVTIVALLLILYLLIFFESFIDKMKTIDEDKVYEKMYEIEMIEDDNYFENWKYISSFTNNKKQEENLETLRAQMEQYIRNTYNVDKCKLENMKILGNIISFDIKLENITLNIEITCKENNEYGYKCNENKQ